eukprot:364873-Chlamydomonas_euryale.AAC.9
MQALLGVSTSLPSSAASLVSPKRAARHKPGSTAPPNARADPTLASNRTRLRTPAGTTATA